LIDGQDLVVLVEALDDLGLGGIDHVVFHVNGRPVYTAYASEAQANGASGQENIYRAVIEPPEGVDGFAVQAVAFDALGQSGASQVVHVGRIDDTVAPKLGVLQPFDRDILTSGEAVTLVAAVTDIGVEAERHVSATWTREYQTETGTWAVLDQFEMTLHRDDNAATRPSIAVSDPTNHYYVYWGQFADGNILRRGAQRNERVRVVTRVSTPNHQVEQENIHEVGMPLSARYFLQPGANAATQGSAHRVFYNAVAQFKSADRTGALLSAWSTIDPMKVEEGLGTDYPIVAPRSCPVCTGLFITDFESEQSERGDIYVFSELMNGASEIFAGTISELHADANFVLAAKQGVPSDIATPDSAVHNFAGSLLDEMKKNPE